MRYPRTLMTTPDIQNPPGSIEHRFAATNLVLLQELSVSFSDLMQNLADMIELAPASCLKDPDCDAEYEGIYIIEDIRDCIAVISASSLFQNLRLSGKSHDDFLNYWGKLEKLVEEWDRGGADRDGPMERSDIVDIMEGIGDTEVEN